MPEPYSPAELANLELIRRVYDEVLEPLDAGMQPGPNEARNANGMF